jgi:D-glycero-alpha-D-manno-heptose 1-phosphate guanylyltransferase
MSLECIILAGGLGTRLQSVIPGLPKCMAPIAGRPFLDYLIQYLLDQKMERFIFSLGHKHEFVVDHLDKQWPNLHKVYVIENEPLGTGGAILLSCKEALQKTVLVVNGDTLFQADLAPVYTFHHMCASHCTLLLKPMKNFNRYGVVEMAADYSIKGFREKQAYEEGTINAGMYLLNAERFRLQEFPEKFSFEKDYLEVNKEDRRIYGYQQDQYFIDIGIPEDYEKAQQELPALFPLLK